MQSNNTKHKTLTQMLIKLWGHLRRKRRTQVITLSLLMITSSATEVISLAAVIPFLLVLANPETIWNKQLIQDWSPSLGINSPEELILPITFLFAFAALLSGVIRIANLWLNQKIAAAIGADLAQEVYRRSLYQNYTTHLSRSSSYMISAITNDVSRLIQLIVYPLLVTFSSGLIILGLLTTLIAIDWLTALSAALIIYIVYFCAISTSKRTLKKQGKLQQELIRKIIKGLQEGLGAIKDVLLDGTQDFYTSIFNQDNRSLNKSQVKSNFLSMYPKLILEPAGMILIALVGYILVQKGGVSQALPVIGALALGAQKLIPLAQKVYEGLAGIINAKDSLALILHLLEQKVPTSSLETTSAELDWRKSIIFDNVCFSYTPNEKEVIRDLSFKINKGERVGLIGSTGSGKSTTLDLLMGLLEPTSGKITVDGEDINDSFHQERLLSWKKLIAHVPQNIYLADCSIAENIAFGIPKENIDMERVKVAARKAQIASYIESSNKSYESFVGERGVGLSGGQRQRVGIARALYKQAKILIFDEATSALDNDTEKAVMASIELLDRELTILIIAHRLETVANCDRLIRLENGKLIAEGKPNEILNLGRKY